VCDIPVCASQSIVAMGNAEVININPIIIWSILHDNSDPDQPNCDGHTEATMPFLPPKKIAEERAMPSTFLIGKKFRVQLS